MDKFSEIEDTTLKHQVPLFSLLPRRRHQRAVVTPAMLLAVRPHPSRILRLPSKKGHRREQDESGHGRGKVNGEKMAILFRSDLRLSSGRFADFAASIAIRLFQRVCTSHKACSVWNSNGQRKVVMSVNGEDGVSRIVRHAREHNIAVAGVRAKNDIQNTNSSQTGEDYVWMAVGIFGPGKVVDRITRGLPSL